MVSEIYNKLNFIVLDQNGYTHSEAATDILGSDIPIIAALCSEIQSRFYDQDLTWEIVDNVQTDDAFGESSLEVLAKGKSMEAIGFIWMLILLWRLHMESNRMTTDIEELLRGSKSENHGEQWYYTHDRADHLLLLKTFRKFNDAAAWFKKRNAGFSVNGPVSLAKILGELHA